MEVQQRVRVHMHSEGNYSLQFFFDANATVLEMKKTLSEHYQIVPEYQILISVGQRLDDSMTLFECYALKKNWDYFAWTCCGLLFIIGVLIVFGKWNCFGLCATFMFFRESFSLVETDRCRQKDEITVNVNLVCKAREWSFIFNKFAYVFDPENDIDYRNVKFASTIRQYRGGLPYILPCGSYFKAIMPLSIPVHYEGEPFIHESSLDNWAVAYHGTTEENVGKIISCGRLKESFAQRMQYGRGIYCSPGPNTALGYAQSYTFKLKQYKMILQVRVNPSMIKVIPTYSHDESFQDYWLVPEDHVRISAVCIYPQY